MQMIVAEMTIGLKYIRKIFGIRYKLNTSVITRPKDKGKAQTKSQVKMLLNYKTLGRI